MRLVGVFRILFLAVGLALAAIGSLGVVYVVLKHPEVIGDFLLLAVSILFIAMGAYMVSVATEEA